MHANIIVEAQIVSTPRVAQLRGLFDLPAEATSRLEWTVALPLEERPWNIGLITGPSGCGKSTVARRLWPAEVEHSGRLSWPTNQALVDAFPEALSIKEVTALLSSVGFSSPPAWLRPFGVLSTGQQFRATLAEELQGHTEFSVHQGNVGLPDDCRRTINEVIEQHGRLDILINNAGINIDKTVVKMSDDDWMKVLAVNLSGAFFLTQAALRHMVERGTGRIVYVSSLAGEIGNIGQANYASSKSGLFGLTKTVAREAAFQLERAGKLTDDSIGITVNTVTPGYIGTEMLASVPEKVIEKVKSSIPLRRLGRPEEIARVVHFLASDASSYITGQVWGVNGGIDM